MLQKLSNAMLQLIEIEFRNAYNETPFRAAGPSRAGLAIPGPSSLRGGRECAWPVLACGASTHARQSIVVG